MVSNEKKRNKNLKLQFKKNKMNMQGWSIKSKKYSIYTDVDLL